MHFFSVSLSTAILLAAWTTRAAANFVLYGNYDADALIAGLALSGPCLAAL